MDMSKNVDTLQSPTAQSILSFANWTASPLSNGNTAFWTFTGSTPNFGNPLHDPIKTPGAKNFQLGLPSNTPTGMSKFWEQTTITTTPVPGQNQTPLSSGSKRPAIEPAQIVELPESEENFALASPPKSNKANDSAFDDTAPPTPQEQSSESMPSQVVKRKATQSSPLTDSEQGGPSHQVQRITNEQVQVRDCGDFSILSKTTTSIIANNSFPPNYRDIIKHEAPEPSAHKYMRMNGSVKSEYGVKLESPTPRPLPCLPSPGLKKHMKEKKYKCEWPNCDKAFYRADELKRHNRVHTKEKPFACPHCDRKFARSDHVRTHVRIHTGEKPYKCNYCSKCFARSDERLRHHKVHEKRLQKEEEARKNQIKMEQSYMNYGPRAVTYYAQPQLAYSHAPPATMQYRYPISTSHQPAGVHHYPALPQQQPQQAPHGAPAQFQGHNGMTINNVPVTNVIEVQERQVQTPQPSQVSGGYYNGPSSRNASWESASQQSGPTRLFYNQN